MCSVSLDYTLIHFVDSLDSLVIITIGSNIAFYHINALDISALVICPITFLFKSFSAPWEVNSPSCHDAQKVFSNTVSTSTLAGTH